MSADSAPLVLDVAALVDQPGTSKSASIDARIPGLEVGLGRVAGDGEVHVEILLEALVEGILVTGDVTGGFQLECSRCLITFEVPFDVPVNEVYAYPDQPQLDEALDADFVVEDDAIDLVPMIRDEVLLAIPVNPLHDPECLGMCQQCGQDRNLADCGHTTDSIDIRWEPLRDLKSE